MSATTPSGKALKVKDTRLRWFADGLILLVVLGLAAFFRLYNLPDTPGWYSDEGTLVNIAQNLLQGRWQYLALNQSTLLAARLPLFTLLLSGWFRLFGAGIDSLRLLTALLGTLSAGLVYLVVRRAAGRGQAALAGALYAIYPQALLYTRIGFSYNLLTPFVLLACLGCWEYLHRRRAGGLALAALAVGLGSVSDLMILTLAPALALAASSRRWRDLLWSLPLMAAPFLLYAAWMLATVPQAFLFDAAFTFGRLGEVPLLGQLPVALLNYAVLLSRDYWIAPGVIGLFLLRPLRWQRLCLMLFFLPLLALSRTTGLASALGLYYMSPLLPFVAIGLASLVWIGAGHVRRTAEDGFRSLVASWGWTPQAGFGAWLQPRLVAFGTSLVLLLVIVTPFLMGAVWTLRSLTSGYQTPIDAVLVDTSQARRAADFLNARLLPEDLVLASPATAWLFQAHAADFQIALAARGLPTRHFPRDIPPERFAFDPRLEQARYVMVDRIWRNWGAPNMPGVADMLAQAESWPLVYSAGEVQVYENPAR